MVLVLISASVERFFVSRKQDFHKGLPTDIPTDNQTSKAKKNSKACFLLWSSLEALTMQIVTNFSVCKSRRSLGYFQT